MMKMTGWKRSLSLLLCTVLLAAAALLTYGCSGNKPAAWEAYTGELVSMGTGERSFVFTVTDAEGNTAGYEVHTDKTVVGEALLELGLIAGDDGPYGLYVKTVGGVTVDPDAGKAYWAFYVNGAYAPKGVDATEIQAGESYAFRVETF